ncbi:AAA family ATPase [Ideonella sp.]|uniref:AAA family ATPase n=1 Tax=Ideonella sp. TaxID=1929293 RepID=UPI003BB55A10
MAEVRARPGIVIALLGAESTGKSDLAAQLAPALAQLTGWSTCWIPEYLREWCDSTGRTPNIDEQAHIADTQAERIEAARLQHDLVVADTTPLMTAVYHQQVFGDESLDAGALTWQRRHCALNLLTALDLPWLADGHQRDGPHVRAPVDGRVRTLLIQAGLPFVVISGQGQARLESALNAVAPWLRTRRAPKAGLFSRLAEREAAQTPWTWSCDGCDQPECEHAALQQRRAALLQGA